MLKKLTTEEPKTELGIFESAANLALRCMLENCMPYCGGLKTVAFDNLETVAY